MNSNQELPSKEVYLATQVTRAQPANIPNICPICWKIPTDPIELHCNHVYCAQCIIERFAFSTQCPMCHAKLFQHPVAAPVTGARLPPETSEFWIHKIPWKWMEETIVLPLFYEAEGWHGYEPLAIGVGAFAGSELAYESRPRVPNPYGLALINVDSLIGRMLGAVFAMANEKEVDFNNRRDLRSEWIAVAQQLLGPIHRLGPRCLRFDELRRYLDAQLCFKPRWLHCATDGNESFTEAQITSLEKEGFGDKLQMVVDFLVESAELEYVMVLASECEYSTNDVDQIMCNRGVSLGSFQTRFDWQVVNALKAYKSGRMSREGVEQAKRDQIDQFLTERF